VRKYLDAHIRTIVVLIGGKLTVILLFYNDAPTQGNKVCLFPRGDVNTGPVPSRLGLLEDSPYHAVGVACLLCD
jgi:hypothetical protein